MRDGQPVLGSGASFGRIDRLLLHSLLLTYYELTGRIKALIKENVQLPSPELN